MAMTLGRPTLMKRQETTPNGTVHEEKGAVRSTMREWEENRYGRRMYPRVASRVWKIGRGLEAAGFRQARSKPWLFIREFQQGPVFANLGSTTEVPIWEDASAMIHDQLRAPDWLRRKILRTVEEELTEHEIPFRYSFYATSEPGGLWVGPLDESQEPFDPEHNFAPPDGRCHRCGCDLLTEDIWCEDCRGKRGLELWENEQSARIPCEVCGDRVPTGYLVVHHVSYGPPEVTVTVCRSCHQQIHRGKLRPDLKPALTPKDMRPTSQPARPKRDP